MSCGYVIQRTDGLFVTRGEHSYTRDLLKACRWASKVDAEAWGVCENERVVPVASLLPPFQPGCA